MWDETPVSTYTFNIMPASAELLGADCTQMLVPPAPAKFPLRPACLLQPRLCKVFWQYRLCEVTLEETVSHFMAAVLTQTRAITEQGVQSLQSDYDQLVQAFQQKCKPERVVKLAAPLQDLKDVAAADSVDTFVLTYTSLLQVLPFLPGSL